MTMPGPFSRRVLLNPLMDTDSYKLSHHLLYPQDVDHVYSYAESRGGVYPGAVFFGLQPLLRRLADTPLTEEMVEGYLAFAHAHGFAAPPERGARRIVEKHHGRLPLRIRALDEGLWTPTRTPLVTVENTDPVDMAWLTSYLETPLLRQTWYGTSVATRIFYIREAVQQQFMETADDLSGLNFAVLDFSSRGCAGYDANEIGGAAYLAMGFMGSDSVPAVAYANHYYDEPMSGFSVIASEHSVTTAWGRERQRGQFLHGLRRVAGTQAPGAAIFSNVSDTYDVFRMCELYASCKEEIMNSGVSLVVRPDSGEMEDVLPEVFRILADGFGVTNNTKGYGVLNGVKVLQGDGINEHSVTLPYQIGRRMGLSAQSIMTGSGGGLMQNDLNRDTLKFAFKASAVHDADGWRGVAKDPITDLGKRSKAGRLAVVRTQFGHFETLFTTSNPKVEDGADNLLRLRYEDGALHNETTLADIRTRVADQIALRLHKSEPVEA